MKQKYTILLVLTDGVINDQQATVDALVSASGEPLSIIILGIGAADFSGMHYLDSDKEPLRSSSGVQAKRDIVQFVSASEFAHKTLAEMSAAVLEEVPRQLLSYMEQHSILPNRPDSH